MSDRLIIHSIHERQGRVQTGHIVIGVAVEVIRWLTMSVSSPCRRSQSTQMAARSLLFLAATDFSGLSWATGCSCWPIVRFLHKFSFIRRELLADVPQFDLIEFPVQKWTLGFFFNKSHGNLHKLIQWICTLICIKCEFCWKFQWNLMEMFSRGAASTKGDKSRDAPSSGHLGDARLVGGGREGGGGGWGVGVKCREQIWFS